MKKGLTIRIILICFLFLNLTLAEAFVKPVVPEKTQVESIIDLASNELLNLKRKDLEEKIGRKLTFKERIAVRIIKKKLKKNTRLQYTKNNESPKVEGMAVAGFVCGLVGIFIAGIILGILGIVFSAIAFKRIRTNPEVKTGKGLAIAGTILGVIAFVGALIVSGVVVF